jgi:hypothetical protein
MPKPHPNPNDPVLDHEWFRNCSRTKMPNALTYWAIENLKLKNQGNNLNVNTVQEEEAAQ